VVGLAAWQLLGDQVWWWYAVVCGLGAAIAWVAMSRPPAPPGSEQPAAGATGEPAR
jgi:hypothetical protein